MKNINECVQYESKNLKKCLNCDGFGILSRREVCKNYEPKTEYFEDYIGEKEDE